MAGELIYTPNEDTPNYPFCRIQFVVETLGHLTNKNLFQIPSCKANKYENVILRLWGLVLYTATCPFIPESI